MNNELDRTHDPFDDQSSAEFEAYLDDLYEQREQDYADAMIARLEQEQHKVNQEIGEF